MGDDRRVQLLPDQEPRRPRRRWRGGDVRSRTSPLESTRSRTTAGPSRYRATVPGGRNSRLDEIQAAVLRRKLPRLDGRNGRRREILGRYAEAAVGTRAEVRACRRPDLGRAPGGGRASGSRRARPARCMDRGVATADPLSATSTRSSRRWRYRVSAARPLAGLGGGRLSDHHVPVLRRDDRRRGRATCVTCIAASEGG